MTKSGWYSLLILIVIGIFMPMLELDIDKHQLAIDIIVNIVYCIVGFIMTKYVVRRKLNLLPGLGIWFLPLAIEFYLRIRGYELTEETLIMYAGSAMLYIYYPVIKVKNKNTAKLSG